MSKTTTKRNIHTTKKIKKQRRKEPNRRSTEKITLHQKTRIIQSTKRRKITHLMDLCWAEKQDRDKLEDYRRAQLEGFYERTAGESIGSLEILVGSRERRRERGDRNKKQIRRKKEIRNACFQGNCDSTEVKLKRTKSHIYPLIFSLIRNYHLHNNKRWNFKLY